MNSVDPACCHPRSWRLLPLTLWSVNPCFELPTVFILKYFINPSMEYLIPIWWPSVSKIVQKHRGTRFSHCSCHCNTRFTPQAWAAREQRIFCSACMLTNECIHTGSRSSAWASSRSIAWAAVPRSFRRRVYFCCAAYAELKSQCIVLDQNWPD